jgi:3-(3-hydroxy-phenyl)propionate hydroxylase
MTMVNANGEVLVHIPAAERGMSGFPDHLSIYQPDIEAAIDARVRSFDSVQVLRGRVLTGLGQDDEAVSLDLARWDGEQAAGDPDDVVTVRASWVIAADGAQSTARGLLGVERDDLGFNERWVNFDSEWRGEVPQRFHDTLQICDPARGRMTMRIGDRRQRFEFAVNEGEDAADLLTPEAAWRLLGDLFEVGEDELTILRRVTYTFEARIAQRWRVGRVFLAGDAAHTMPPYLGQGACSGMRDAANLAWKLDLVLRGRAAASLLDSYEPERRPHATALVHGSIGLGRIANTRDPDAAAARDAAFRAGKVPPPPGMPTLTQGILHRGPDGTLPPGVGGLTPQGLVRRDGVTGRLDDLVGFGFLLVSRFRPADVLTADQLAVLTALGCATVDLTGEAEDVDGVLLAFLDSLDADAYLARPDFVLFGAARRADLGTLVEAFSGSLGLLPQPAGAPS